MEGIKVIMAALAGVFLAAVLKSVKSEMTMLVAAGVSVFILFYILSGLSVIVEQLKMLQGYIGISGKYIGILVKMIGISYMTQLAADICRDKVRPRWRDSWRYFVKSRLPHWACRWCLHYLRL